MSNFYVVAHAINFWQSFASKAAAQDYCDICNQRVFDRGHPYQEYAVLDRETWSDWKDRGWLTSP